MTSILFVCTGNICRSPTADAVMRHFATINNLNLMIDSAGTHGYHIGEQPDSRSIQTAKSHGIEMSFLKARKIHITDFEKFDYLIAMDNGHLKAMKQMSPKEHQNKIHLFLDFTAEHKGQDIPDPYYGTLKDFDHTYKLILKGCESMVKSI